MAKIKIVETGDPSKKSQKYKNSTKTTIIPLKYTKSPQKNKNHPKNQRCAIVEKMTRLQSQIQL